MLKLISSFHVEYFNILTLYLNKEKTKNINNYYSPIKRSMMLEQLFYLI